MTKIKNIRHTVFGNYYTHLPRVARKQLLKEALKRGVSPSRLRGWMYYPTVPNIEILEIMEELTGQKYEHLFPY